MTRAPVTLSREMKILLTALGLMALLGGWLVWSNQKQHTETVVTTPVVTPANTTPNTTTGQGGTTKVEAGAGKQAGTTTVPVAPSTGVGANDGKTEVATVPPFPVTDPNGSTPDPTVLVPVPSGINPNQPLNSLNGRNPFTPLKIDNTGVTAAQPTTPAPTVNTPGVTIQRPTSTPAQIDSALGRTGGALPVPQIPTTATVPSIPTKSGSKPSVVAVTNPVGGALPIPQIPGTGNQTPTTTVKVPGATASVNETPKAPKPIAPPVTSVKEPTVNVPNTPVQAGTAGGASQGSAVSTGNPQVISALQPNPTPAPVTETPAGITTPAENKAETAINAHQLVFDAAVLGPVNTAVFRSDTGFLVASVGQPIPNTNLILKEVTTTTATLTVGSDSKTLELDKR